MEISYSELNRLTYQGAKACIEKMTDDKAIEMLDEVQRHLTEFYSVAQGYAPDKKKYCKFGPGDEHYIVKERAPVGPKDFIALMSGIKKLEVLYGYLYDRVEHTEFSNVR